MKIKLISCLILFTLSLSLSALIPPDRPVRILVVTGGHDYNAESLREMLVSLSPDITYQMAEFPAAYDMFLPVNRGRYDVLVFYHMWDKITDDQARMFVDCIKSGKPVI